jgi:hypothetical protein
VVFGRYSCDGEAQQGRDRPPPFPRSGYDDSAAMKAKRGTCTFDEFNKFLAGPTNITKHIAGTKMTFAGLNNEYRRADLIACRRTLSGNPSDNPPSRARTIAASAFEPSSIRDQCMNNENG